MIPFHSSTTPARGKELLGDPDQSTCLRISENYHEWSRSFWDPILELKGAFSGVLLYSEAKGGNSSGALRAPKRIVPGQG